MKTFNKFREELRNVNLGRGIFTRSGWRNSTTVDDHSQDKRHDEERVSAGWARFPTLPFLRTLSTYNSYYFLSKFLSCIYSSNALTTIYPISIVQASEKVFVYFKITKEFIFTGAMRQKYGKMSYPGLQAYLMPSELNYVCKENIPILTHVANDDCESTLIHPSTMSIPPKVCE